MLIEPTDVASYSVYDRVKNRPEELLAQDIIEAEAEAALITATALKTACMIRCPVR